MLGQMQDGVAIGLSELSTISINREAAALVSVRVT